METKFKEPLTIGGLPIKNGNRYNRELRATIERAFKFSGVKYHWLRTSIEPNSDRLAPVRTVIWEYFAYELASPVIAGSQRQVGPHSNLKVLQQIGEELRLEKASALVQFKFWLWVQWAQLTTEAE